MSVSRFSSIASCFPVADVGATMRWYEERLGFTGHPFPELEPYAFCILVRDRLESLRPLEKQFYGDWEFEVKDPNGYVLVFSELTD